MTSKHFDVAIVGAGIVGVTAALALSRQGYQVALIDRQAQPSAELKVDRKTVEDFSARVSAVTPANVAFFERLGVWQHIRSEHVLPYQFMDVWEELGGGRIHFDAAEYQAPALGSIVENHVLLAACFTAIQEREGIAGYFEHDILSTVLESDSGHGQGEPQQDYRIAFSNGESVLADLLVGADGANSHIRKALNLPTREWDYEQQAIVCTVEMAQAHGLVARQRFSESGPVAFLPLNHTLDAGKQSRFCSIVWSIDTAKADAVMALSDEAFSAQLAAQIEGELGGIKAVSKRFKFPLRQRHAKRYAAKQAILIGDAAHSIHPLAGQGLNLGLDDVQALSGIAQDAKAKSYPLGHPVLLKRYERTRKSENLAMMLGMEGFKRLFGAQDPVLRLLRNIGVDTVNRHTLVKRQIAKKAMGL